MSKSVRNLLSSLLMLALVAPARAHAEQITVAAAADLTFAFQEVAARFQKDTGNSVKLSFGSSGNFYSQIQNGAPYDLFFSADITYPQKLEAAGLAEPGSLHRYAEGKIVLWVPNGSSMDLGHGLKALLEPSVRKIAIANPEHAPYGRAAVAALQHEQIYDKVRDKLVMGENISQAAQFVLSGDADAGIIALSLTLAPAMAGKGRSFEIPPSSYPAIDQACVILKSSQRKQVAQQFLDYLRQPEIVALMHRYGFVAPESAAAAPR
ncbi:MAG TPA: molybdate ABC transporter substrate-binding protein [Terriglobia bacterium]|nr:molybdate ABC transporter substrate-binding protein [Terriglobia bacterium]